ncbi:MAG TPA: hypothetical protein VLF40_02255 [Candidatus Saccharimonadales bacterium]|nr:hypothetical protein [Candidatus Saccharimonadales bacterium]
MTRPRLFRGQVVQRTLFAVVSLVTLVFGQGFARVFATDCPAGLSHLDCESIINNWPDYIPQKPCSTTGSSATSVLDGQNTGTWNSGLQPPYILEQFMIETLKDIAHKEGKPESDAVTQQHVIALLAFAWGEGGGITNNDFWNPFNTGINAPDLTVGGVHVTNGVQAFKSFDAGVEATARSMTGSTQGRLGLTLTDPNTTAMDFLNSWLDFPPQPPYPTGHYPWAEASDPSSKYYQPTYRQDHVNLINQATQNYVNMASTIMRGAPSDPSDTHDPSKLFYQAPGGTTASGSSTQNACLTSGSGFFVTATGYAWPTYHSAPYCVMKPEYITAVNAAIQRILDGKNDYVGGGSLTVSDGNCKTSAHAGIDCGGFVTRVFRDSGADPNYNANDGNVVAQYGYVYSHPDLYQKVVNPSKSNLKPGDIFFESNLGHTYIYMGANGYPGYDSVSASFSTTGQSWRTPMASNAYDISSSIWYRPLFSLSGAGAATGVLQ